MMRKMMPMITAARIKLKILIDLSSGVSFKGVKLKSQIKNIREK